MLVDYIEKQNNCVFPPHFQSVEHCTYVNIIIVQSNNYYNEIHDVHINNSYFCPLQPTIPTEWKLFTVTVGQAAKYECSSTTHCKAKGFIIDVSSFAQWLGV